MRGADRSFRNTWSHLHISSVRSSMSLHHHVITVGGNLISKVPGGYGIYTALHPRVPHATIDAQTNRPCAASSPERSNPIVLEHDPIFLKSAILQGAREIGSPQRTNEATVRPVRAPISPAGCKRQMYLGKPSSEKDETHRCCTMHMHDGQANAEVNAMRCDAMQCNAMQTSRGRGRKSQRVRVVGGRLRDGGGRGRVGGSIPMWVVTLQPAGKDTTGHDSTRAGEEEAAWVAISSASVLRLVTRFGGLVVEVACIWTRTALLLFACRSLFVCIATRWRPSITVQPII